MQILRQAVNLVTGRLGSRMGTAITFDMRCRLSSHLHWARSVFERHIYW